MNGITFKVFQSISWAIAPLIVSIWQQVLKLLKSIPFSRTLESYQGKIMVVDLLMVYWTALWWIHFLYQSMCSDFIYSVKLITNLSQLIFSLLWVRIHILYAGELSWNHSLKLILWQKNQLYFTILNAWNENKIIVKCQYWVIFIFLTLCQYIAYYFCQIHIWNKKFSPSCN